MSRVANQPVLLPSGVELKLEANKISIKGSKGSLSREIPKLVNVIHESSTLRFEPADNSSAANALAGSTRAHTNNMVIGVTNGFECELQLVGVGFRAQAQGKQLNLTIGFSHPVSMAMPEGVTVETPSQTAVVVKGVDKQQVFQVAANIREKRPPEPYKGKGIRYKNEVIVLKETKKK